MSQPKDHDFTATELDPALAPHRLKEGLIPEGTAIFLQIDGGPQAGRVFTLSAGGVYIIGREGADIALDDRKVSRRHAEIGLYGPGAFVLRDLASTNGTRVNERRIKERTRLAHGDRIRVGDTVLGLAVVENGVPVASS